MGLVSALTLIRTVSLFHITAAWFFLAAPRILSDQNVVFMLGESMRMNHATAFDKPSEASAFVAVLLVFIGLADLTAASMEELVALHYWASNVPVRLTFLFALTGYTYLFKENGVLGSGSAAKASIGEPLQNSLVFTFGIFEIAMWFWIFTTLREDRRDLLLKQAEALQAREDRL